MKLLKYNLKCKVKVINVFINQGVFILLSLGIDKVYVSLVKTELPLLSANGVDANYDHDYRSSANPLQILHQYKLQLGATN